MSAQNNTQFQAEHHPIVFDGTFASLTDYCLHLLHLKSYEEAATSAAGKVVLDLGCNNGYGTAMLGEFCDRITGLDVSPAAIADACARYGDRGINFRVFDGRRIPFDDNAFDMVVSFQVIEHVADTSAYLAEIARVLRPGGLALFTTPNAAIRLDPGMKPWNEFHVREYCAGELADTLTPVFGEVAVRGLFASDDLYRIEYERCQAARQSARDGNRPQPVSFAKRLRQDGKRIAKAALPARVVDYLRARAAAEPTVHANPQPHSLSADVIGRYSTKDLFYRHDNSEEALDLMAVCRAA